MALDDGWMLEGLCRELPPAEADRIFFPQKHKGIRTDYRRAKAICHACPVRTSCLAFAIAHKITDGVWGGYSDDERKSMSREVKKRYRTVWRRLHPVSSRG